MENNKSGLSFNILAIVGVFILMLYIFTLSNKIDQVEQNVIGLQYELSRVSEELKTLVEANRIVSDSEYRVERVEKDDKFLGKVAVDITSNKLGAYTKLELLYRKTYDFQDADNYDYSNEPWQNTEINNNNGTYSAELIVPFSSNYELKVAFQEDNQLNYEQLPQLDLYSKSEHIFMKAINIYEVKDSKLEFDVQISKFSTSDDTKLLSGICNIYYGNDTVKSIDILKANQVSGRKEPRAQLEHLGGSYWFIIEEVDFSNQDEFDKSKVTIEIVLKDSLGNCYQMVKGVE